MEHRRLGRTDLNVSLICLGTMTWGQQNTEADGHAQMDYALDKGINFFDTAELYSIPPRPETQGSTERIIGSWFKARGSRDKVILATKVIGRSDNTWFRDDGSKGELSRAQVEEAVNKSLKRLQTDYIDLYQIHWPDRPMPWGSNPTIFRHQEGESHPIAETVEIMTDLVKAGKIRHFGLSNESAWGTMSFLKHADAKGQARVQSVQNAYNLLNRTYEVALAEVTMQREREPARLFAARPGLPDRQISRRRPSAGHADHPVRPRAALREPDRRSGDPQIHRARQGVRPRSGPDGARLRQLAPLPHIEHHRRDLDGAAQDGHCLHRRDDHPGD